MDKFNAFFNQPMTHIGLGLLGSQGNIGQGIQTGLLSNAAFQRNALAMQQAEDEKKRQQQEQLWAQKMGYSPGMPDWAMKTQFESQYAKPDLPSGMRQGPNGPEWIPGYLEAQERLRRAGKTSVEVHNAPKLPAGYMWENPQIQDRVKPIPGGPAEREAMSAEMEVSKALDVANDGVKLIDEMMSHPGLEYAVGASSALPIIPGTPAADFDAKAKQLEGKAFLQAFETLKGGGQITQIEGEKATAAIARLQRAQSENEYKASLRELRNIYQRAAARGRSSNRRNTGSQRGAWSVEQE